MTSKNFITEAKTFEKFIIILLKDDSTCVAPREPKAKHIPEQINLNFSNFPLPTVVVETGAHHFITPPTATHH